MEAIDPVVAQQGTLRYPAVYKRLTNQIHHGREALSEEHPASYAVEEHAARNLQVAAYSGHRELWATWWAGSGTAGH